MRYLRRLLLAAFAATVVLALVACGGGSDSSSKADLANGSNPLTGKSLYVNPDNHGLLYGNTKEQQLIGSKPTAKWFGSDPPTLSQDVREYVSAAAAKSQLPVLVAYYIPDRDCGGSSAGGASSRSAYRTWIDRFAAGIGSSPTVVVLEPDALAQTIEACHRADADHHVSLLAYAVKKLKALPATYVYIDAGNAGWIDDPAELASVLTRVGVARADGFALNVANYETTGRSISYGTAVSRRLEGKHFVIDTGRNGAGPTYEAGSKQPWCNQPGQKLGNRPTTDTGVLLVDAYLWVKQPGDSDGRCNGITQSAGEWSPKLARQLTSGS
jgi:endoglucanase